VLRGDESKGKGKILSTYQSILDERDRANSSLYRKNQSAIVIAALRYLSLLEHVDSAVSRA
jgi:hypothetical protein